MSVLEVFKPASKHGIEVCDYALQAVPAGAARLCPNTLTQRLQAFTPHPAPSGLEAITQEREAFALFAAIPNVGLGRIERKPVVLNPGVHFLKCRLRFCDATAKHDEIVGIAHHPITFVLHMTVQGMQVDVRQQRADHSPYAKGNFQFERVVKGWRSIPLLDFRRKR